MKYVILMVMWALFYSSHSILASTKIKKKFRELMGYSYKWYRLAYSIFTVLFFLGILLYSATIPVISLLVPSALLTYLGFVLAAFGTIIAVKSFKDRSVSKFLGFVPLDDLKSEEKLNTKGVYQWVRHPLYAGLVLVFMGFFFYLPYLNSLIHLLALLFYLPFGIYFEEKKLIFIYGEEYLAYKAKVPPLIPIRRP